MLKVMHRYQEHHCFSCLHFVENKEAFVIVYRPNTSSITHTRYSFFAKIYVYITKVNLKKGRSSLADIYNKTSILIAN